MCGTSSLLACGPLDPEPPSDAEGNPLPLPPPGEDWLRVVEVSPSPAIATEATIEVRFSEYLDPDTLNSYATLSLRSGGIVAGGRLTYRMSRKALLYHPRAPLEAELRYTLQTSPALRSVVGSPLAPETPAPIFFTDETLPAAEPPTRESVRWEDIAPILERSCASCHADQAWQLPQLSRDALRQTRSSQVDLPLVMPFEPARSYLMHKILADYPRRRFTVQPPPYSDAPPLAPDEIELIEDWIAGGAR
ncbi:hypothetical protein DL240_11830 [Lujinxingia litoralis]|uniref:SbsA Ig-like domain-containing protein n=1 Tax=Lujinxingia litoralis TaxID=2211119 RepID=A0A328C9A5_9DELT|nr:hypothetical protein DL240_11830 [Lujinxingia litoralis]